MGRLSTVDLLVKVACLAKKKLMFAISKAADLYYITEGGKLYSPFPFSKASLVYVISSYSDEGKRAVKVFLNCFKIEDWSGTFKTP